MSVRNRAVQVARQRWRRFEVELGTELRTARHVLNLTQGQLGSVIGVSASEISRRELGMSPRLTGGRLAEHAAAVGLRLSIKLWPVGGGVRDAAQVRLVAKFMGRVGRSWRVTLEAPIPIAGDLRAADALMVRGATCVAVEAITRLADLQAQVRAARLKARDIGATRLMLVVAGTNANRAAIVQTRTSLAESFDLDTRRLIADLAAGRDPGRDGIIVM